MPRARPLQPVLRRAVGVTIVAAGVAVNTGFDAPFRTVPSLLLIAIGVASVTSTAREYSSTRLRRCAKRWWLIGFATFVPYALATAPNGESAAAVGAAFSGPVVGAALEAVAGATVLCALSVTVLYGFARYGIHPGRPTPEERILPDD